MNQLRTQLTMAYLDYRTDDSESIFRDLKTCYFEGIACELHRGKFPEGSLGLTCDPGTVTFLSRSGIRPSRSQNLSRQILI